MLPADNAKQLIVERIRQSTNILIAVSTNPTVDALSAALALTLLLNKLDKHATAVFSGQMPPAMQFLEPGKTFENTVDSLRDFIISLDKEKADRLRYKEENGFVRIFITPYKTTISQEDFQFSQGDFNVELIVALGVDKREDLDKAIVAHGRILHDATVVTINANNQTSSLGTVDWHDMNASSLSELITTLAEAFGQPGLLDAQMSTALLTGLVASTERFSNQLTTPRVMTMAAQLMAAGANQQLVASNLQVVVQGMQPLPGVSAPVPKPDGQLDIAHADKKKSEPQPIEKVPEKKPAKKSAEEAEAELAAALPALTSPPPRVMLEDLEAVTKEQASKDEPDKMPSAPGSVSVNATDAAEPQQDGFIVGQPSWKGRTLQPPRLGGTLNATAEQAFEDSRRAQEKERNQTLLSHGAEEGQAQSAPLTPPTLEPMPALPAVEPQPFPEPQPAPFVPPVSEQPSPEIAPPLLVPVEPSLPPPAPEPTSIPPPSMFDSPFAPPVVIPPPASALPSQPEVPQAEILAADLDAARQAVHDVYAAEPFNPAGKPLDGLGTQALPQVPSVDMPPAPAANALPTLPSLPPLPPMPPLPQTDIPPAPDVIPPMPDLQVTPPVPPTNFEPPQNQPQPPTDPGQFKIPGQ